jgi:pimeloyl-ACP methyl ester carboxylesterase
MGAVASNTLAVPGATLHYETRGDGPPLLLIGDSATDATAYETLATVLAARCTVVTFDPRGNARSKLDGPPVDQWVEVHADDAHRLLATLGTAPALVLGDGTGALVGLELVTRRPAQVHTLVAFEPPAAYLLSEAPPSRDGAERPLDDYRVDVNAVRTVSTRIVLATGPRPQERPAGRAALAMAALLGKGITDLPGAPRGDGPDPFAAALVPFLTP